MGFLLFRVGIQTLYMDEKFLRQLLAQKAEADWFDFKRKLKLYSIDGKLNAMDRDELVKDILGLANGNTNIIRKTKYLIIGADDKEFTLNGLRALHHVDYRVPTQSEIDTWLHDACTPAVVGISCSLEQLGDSSLYIISIPPTFELHEVTRVLSAKGRYNEHTVFMRQGEHTVPASIRDGVAIQQLKIRHRQETLNPPTVIFSAILGAVIGIIFWNAGYNTPQSFFGEQPLTWFVTPIFLLLTGGFLSGTGGWIYQQFKTFHYDWRYWSIRQRIRAGLIIGIMLLLRAAYNYWLR